MTCGFLEGDSWERSHIQVPSSAGLLWLHRGLARRCLADQLRPGVPFHQLVWLERDGCHWFRLIGVISSFTRPIYLSKGHLYLRPPMGTYGSVPADENGMATWIAVCARASPRRRGVKQKLCGNNPSPMRRGGAGPNTRTRAGYF